MCARDAAGTTWCTRANAAGAFLITSAEVAPGTGTGPIPEQGVLTVYTVDCPGGGKPVDRGGAEAYGGPWLDVRCTPDGCVAAPSGLLAWYRFDETAGTTAADFPSVGGPSPLALHGGSHVEGKVLGALALDTDAYAVGDASKNVGTGDFSIALWIRVAPGGAGGISILDKRDTAPIRGYHLVLYFGEPLIQLADGGDFGGWYNYTSGITSLVLADGGWHHLAVTVRRASREGIRWYVDGVPAGEVGDPTGRQGSLSSGSPLYVGRHSFYEEGWLRGAIDELQIVNRVLEPGEVSTLFARHACR